MATGTVKHRGGFTMRVSSEFEVPDEEGYSPKHVVEGIADDIMDTLYTVCELHNVRIEYDDYWVE